MVRKVSHASAVSCKLKYTYITNSRASAKKNTMLGSNILNQVISKTQ